MLFVRRLITATDKLSASCQKINFGAPTTHVYHPLVYAQKSHRLYLQKYATAPKRTVFLGINPGPWGMAQTGVPFGEVTAVRDWMGISAAVAAPLNAHPRRPVRGFDCPRSEVSGRRLWGLFAARFGAADNFFAEHLVLNYCPLLFSAVTDSRCTNITPDKLCADEKTLLFAACDDFLRSAIEILQPAFLIGIGGFAEQRLAALFGDSGATIGKILHPSPANPLANRNFTAAATVQLQNLEVWPQ